MGKILAIDASTDACSVALAFDGETQELFEIAPRQHTKKLLPMVDELLAEHQISLSQLDAIAFGQGPGSFTGLRIASGVVQGLAFGADLPVIGISSLAAMAQGLFRVEDTEQRLLYCLCVMDAHMGEVYSALYSLWDGYLSLKMLENVNVIEKLALPPPPTMMPDTDMLIIGDGSNLIFERGSSLFNNLSESEKIKRRVRLMPQIRPHAQDICALAQIAWQNEEVITAEQAVPVYIRDKTTWKKRHEQ